MVASFLDKTFGESNGSLTISEDTTFDDTPSQDVMTVKWCGISKEHGAEPPFKFIEIPEEITEEKLPFSVKLKTASITCPPGVNSSVFTLNLTRPFRFTMPSYESEFSTTGYFRVDDFYYPREGYCINDWTESDLTVRVCGKFINMTPKVTTPKWSYPECGTNHPCIPKCCAMNKLWTVTAKNNRSKTCQDKYQYSKNIDPILYDWPSQRSSIRRPVYYFRNRLTCNKSTFVHATNQLDPVYQIPKLCFRIRSDGMLLVRDIEYNWVEIPVTDYCMDGNQFDGSFANRSSVEFSGEEKQYGVVTCMTERKKGNFSKNFYNVMYGSASVVGAVFLLLTFGVYVLLWKEQKIQGWTTMSHSATMFFMYCFLASNQFLEIRSRSIASVNRSSLCILSGVLTHFFFLSNFCWLTVICFSLFWTFRGINPSNPNSKNIGQYFLYAAFGWGVPFLSITASFVLDQKYSYEPCNQFIVPEYGLVTCTVSPGALGLYMYYPVAVLLTLNLIFFAITSYKLYQYKKSTSMARENLDENKQLFQLIAKLFFVMGFTWIFEFISWWHSGLERKWYWAIPDVINSLQAIAIFAIYVCKSNVSKSLKRNYPRLRPFLSICSKFEETLGFGGREPETTATHFGSTTVDARNKRFYPQNIYAHLI
ncbi:unnamed protein product [Allacma fusca]|uniref:G-protein coupled receptors family 2 profile 2 domain-containing protein n=1 Tax=Allacma fusca TaxID=39272 RepID=A0A8J2NRS1_9HEXA|nr:unnamed protein product [Allacma fusca]